MARKLTTEQVTNWRNMLLQLFGPAAFLLSSEDIEDIREHMQAEFDARSTPGLSGSTPGDYSSIAAAGNQ